MPPRGRGSLRTRALSLRRHASPLNPQPSSYQVEGFRSSNRFVTRHRPETGWPPTAPPDVSTATSANLSKTRCCRPSAAAPDAASHCH